MSEAKFTPGPWYGAGPLGAGIYVISEKRPIAVVYGPNNEVAPQADARLIAAAPDLYAALELEHKAFKDLYRESLAEPRDVVRIIDVVNRILSSDSGRPVDAALAKARGEVRP